jgi:hypothetical protein
VAEHELSSIFWTTSDQRSSVLIQHTGILDDGRPRKMEGIPSLTKPSPLHISDILGRILDTYELSRVHSCLSPVGYAVRHVPSALRLRRGDAVKGTVRLAAALLQ